MNGMRLFLGAFHMAVLKVSDDSNIQAKQLIMTKGKKGKNWI